ncbi:MAG TPA: hypothetical protein VNC18_07710 [Gemmatimonadaceae bacterium]|jgi:hypothetical protein|nr:hypothetical protein [Gemmatimonadaceae bacterium]
MRHRMTVLVTTLVCLATASTLSAQISVTPMIGGYVPATDVNQIGGSAENIAKTREGTLSLGLNVGLGPLRGTLAYASGTTIKNASSQNIGKGNVLAAAADLVIRPLPRILVQPYLLAGAGKKFYRYDASAALGSGVDKEAFALHGGVGADLSLGKLGVVAELTDFLSKGAEDKWNAHDAFLMFGVKVPLGP